MDISGERFINASRGKGGHAEHGEFLAYVLCYMYVGVCAWGGGKGGHTEHGRFAADRPFSCHPS